MELWFSCGLYECLVVGNGELINSIPSEWVKYQIPRPTGSKIITIYLEEEKDEVFEKISEGWHLIAAHGNQQAAYTINGDIAFSLRKVAPAVVVVKIARKKIRNVRLGFQYGFMTAVHQECIGLHGVTLLCEKEIIVLSAPSGTGKTTLAKLLEKYCDAVVINGDFALLAPAKDGVIFEPTPFCGTSDRALNHRFRVNRVVFLGQAQENYWRTLDGREAMGQFMSNTFVPDWDRKMTQTVQGNILKCINMLKVNAYDFAPTQDAAEMFLEKILH